MQCYGSAGLWLSLHSFLRPGLQGKPLLFWLISPSSVLRVWKSKMRVRDQVLGIRIARVSRREVICDATVDD